MRRRTEAHINYALGHIENHRPEGSKAIIVEMVAESVRVLRRKECKRFFPADLWGLGIVPFCDERLAELLVIDDTTVEFVELSGL